MNSQTLAVFIEELLFDLHSYCIRICALQDLDMHSTYPVALVQAPQMPLLNLYNSLDVGKSLQLILQQGNELPGIHFLKQGEAYVKAQWDRQKHNDHALHEAQQVFQDSEIDTHPVHPEVAEAVDEFAPDQE